MVRVWDYGLVIVCVCFCLLHVGNAYDSDEEYDIDDRRRPRPPRPRPPVSLPLPVYRPRYWNNRPLGPLRDPVVFCYWGSWANLRPGVGAFGVEDMPTDLCTHIAYTFIAPTAEAELILPEVYNIPGKSNRIEDFIRLKERNKDLKLMVAIGGYNAGSANFSIVSNDDTLRAKLVTNLVKYMESNKFDGLDLDWEYPGQNGGAPTDKEAFVWLIRDLKEAFRPRNWVLTAAVGSTQYHIDQSYDVPALSQYLDYISLMTYDYHGSWSEGTGANAPLFPQTSTDNSGLNVNHSLYTWVNNGAERRKLVLGLASYGKTFVLADRDVNGIGAPFTGLGDPGTFTQETGLMSYYEICLDQRSNPTLWNVSVVDNSYVYANKDDFWISYDNNDTMFIKGLYARYEDLAGVMFWTMDFDDFSGACKDDYALIRSSIEGFCNGAAIIQFWYFMLATIAALNIFIL